MRPVRLAARAFVYGTEDEARVVSALLWALSRDDDPAAKGTLMRSRMKGHFGTEVLLYEGVLKNVRDLRRCFDRMREAPALVASLREQFNARMDEEAVLHFRIDKQAAVERRWVLGSGGDAIAVEVKYAAQGPRTGPEGFPGPDTARA